MISLKKLNTLSIERLNFVEVFGLLALLGLLLYAGVVSYPFVHDDYVFIVGNAQLAHWDNLKELFLSPSFLAEESEAIVNTYYRPILEIINKCLFLAFQLVPRGYHLFNVVIHILNSFLVYWLLLRLSKRKGLALGISLFFLIHPVQTEAVCAIAGASNLVSALFCFLSLFFYLKQEDFQSFWGRAAHLILALFFFLLALFTKESSVMLPGLLVLYEWFRGGVKPERRQGHERVIAVVSFFCLLIGYFVFRQLIFHQALPDMLASQAEFWMRIAAIPQTLLMYVRLLVFPNDLHYYRSVDILQFSIYPSIVLCSSGFLIFSFVRTWPQAEKRLALLGGGCFFVALAPMLNIVPLVNEYSLILTSEHFLYMPFVGFFLFFFVAGQKIFSLVFKERAKQAAMIGMIFVGVIFALITKEQIRYWQGEIPLFQRTLMYHPEFGRVRILLARAYYFAKDYDAAISEYSKALSIMENYRVKAQGSRAEGVYRLLIKNIHFEIAHCYEAREEFLKAIEHYRQAEKIDALDDRVYNNLGINYFYVKNIEEAARCFKKALALNPSNMMALNNLAFYYVQKGELDQAEKMLEKVLVLEPESTSAQRNLDEVRKTQEEQKGKKLKKP